MRLVSIALRVAMAGRADVVLPAEARADAVDLDDLARMQVGPAGAHSFAHDQLEDRAVEAGARELIGLGLREYRHVAQQHRRVAEGALRQRGAAVAAAHGRYLVAALGLGDDLLLVLRAPAAQFQLAHLAHGREAR